MTILDWIIIGVLGALFLRGFFRGFLVELFALIGLLGGYLAARFLGPVLSLKLIDETSIPPWIAGVASMLILFFAIAIGFHFLARMIRGLMRAAQLGGVDRTMGGVFGLFKGAVIILALFLIIAMLPYSTKFTQYAYSGKVSKHAWKMADTVRAKLKLDQAKLNIPGFNFDEYFQKLGWSKDLTTLISKDSSLKDAMMKNMPSNLKSATVPEAQVKLPNMSKDAQDRIQRIVNAPEVDPNMKAEDIWKIIQGQYEKAGIEAVKEAKRQSH